MQGARRSGPKLEGRLPWSAQGFEDRVLCRRCEDARRRPGDWPQFANGSRIRTCERCGVAILTLEGVVVGVGDDTLAQLARFGLAATGELLLEPQRGST